MENTLEARELRIAAQDLKTIHLKSLNYVTYVTGTTGDDIVIRYNDNRFRRLDVVQDKESLYLEERMTVTIYGLFRAIELMEGNRLTIEVPAGCENLHLVVESTTMGITMRGLRIAGASLTTGTGAVRIQGVSFADQLSAISSAGRIACELPGTAADYDIVCCSDRRDLWQPPFPRNPSASRKVILRSGTSVPELTFLG